MSETSNEPPQEEGINSPRNLALEATFINHNFSQQVLRMSDDKLKMEEPNPFLSEDEVGEVASVAYRYRKWDLDGGIVLVARCEHDAVTTGSSSTENQFISIKALNEWDSRVRLICRPTFLQFVIIDRSNKCFGCGNSCLEESNGARNWTRSEELSWLTS